MKRNRNLAPRPTPEENKRLTYSGTIKGGKEKFKRGDGICPFEVSTRWRRRAALSKGNSSQTSQKKSVHVAKREKTPSVDERNGGRRVLEERKGKERFTSPGKKGLRVNGKKNEWLERRSEKKRHSSGRGPEGNSLSPK